MGQKQHHKYKIKIPHINTKIKVKKSSMMIFSYVSHTIVNFFANYGYLILSVAIAYIIFKYSNQPATESANASHKAYAILSQLPLAKAIFNVIPIRKCAHMFLYCILSLTVFMHFRFKSEIPHIWALLSCFIYACTDEFHQLFVPGRGAVISDIGFDCIEAFIGIITTSITLRLIYKYLERHDDYINY